MDISELKAIVEYAREQGLKRISLGDGVEIELGEAPRPKRAPNDVEKFKKALQRRKYTDADIMLWSTMEELPSDRAERLKREEEATQPHLPGLEPAEPRHS